MALLRYGVSAISARGYSFVCLEDFLFDLLIDDLADLIFVTVISASLSVALLKKLFTFTYLRPM